MMILLLIHSILRWIVFISISSSILIAWRGYRKNLNFIATKSNLLRYWTVLFTHTQLIIGMLLAFRSPHFTYFWKNTAVAWTNPESVFYGLIHPFLMLLAIIILTIGSAKAKRATSDKAKFKVILVWYSITIILIFIAIPWPFSPFSARPLIPTY